MASWTSCASCGPGEHGEGHVDAGRYASGPLGVRSGTVMEFERPMRITFHQPMTMKLHLGTADVLMR
jgi:hypothetical protein